MEDDIWADRAFYDDGEWVHWSEIEEQVRFKEWGAKYPNARKSLIPYFEELLSLAEGYHLETGLHLNVYGDIGELYGAITHGLKLHKTYAQGSDGRLGNDFIEVKTITPFKQNDEVTVKLSGNFNKLLVVRINENFEVSSKLVDRKSLPKTKREFVRVKWGDLEPFRDLLLRDDVVEIAINPDGKVWIEAAGDATMRHEGQTVDRATAFNMAQTIVGDANARVSEKNPLVSGKVEYSGRPLRVQVAVPPAIEQGASITIRLFATAGVQGYTPSYLFGKAVSLDQLRAEKMKDIASQAEENLGAALEALVHQRLNVLISGGTSTGKTTFARHLLTHIDDGERLITIEDAFELFPSQPNTVALLASRSTGSQRSSHALLQASLRMRPDRIIVGELRGDEALTYLEAINTGHGGSVSTIHAETAELAIDRLAIMVLQAGTPLTFAEVRQYIRKSIDVIVQLGRADGKRGIAEFYLPNLTQ